MRAECCEARHQNLFASALPIRHARTVRLIVLMGDSAQPLMLEEYPPVDSSVVPSTSYIILQNSVLPMSAPSSSERHLMTDRP